MLEQEQVRQRYLFFLGNCGTKQNWIAKKTDIPDYILSKYKLGKTELLNSSLRNLDKFLVEQGY